MVSDSDSTRSTRDLDGESRERVLAFHNLGPGSQFAARYRILRPLGHGGSGEVYAAHDEVAGVDVALKVLYPGSGASSLERLRRELRLLRAMTHPGILRIHDIGLADGLLYLVTELLEGESLKSLLERSGSLSPERAEVILEGILDALAAAHGAGILHRDIKPANVFLVRERSSSQNGEEGVAPAGDPARVVLLDFGIARRIGEPGLTTRGRFIGTPEYAAPEQILGESALSPAADLYALGVTAWEMLTGRPPFRGDSEFGTLEAQVKQAPPFVELPRGLDSRWREWLRVLLEKNPRRRPRSARQALAWLRGEGALLPRLWRMAGRGRRLLTRAWLLLAGAGLALVLGGWALSPVVVEADRSGGAVIWHTRGGMMLRRKIPGEGRLLAALDGSGWGPFRAAWAARFPERRPSKRWPLYRARGLLMPFSLFFLGRGCSTSVSVEHYEGYKGPMIPQRLVVLPPSENDFSPRIAVAAQQQPNFPWSITFLTRSGSDTGSYEHPGEISSIIAARPPGTEENWLYLAGVNNLLGPRLFVAGVPLSDVGMEYCQSPPYSIPHEMLKRAPGWYVPLPTGRSLRGVSLEVTRRGVRVFTPEAGTLLLDFSTGVPVDSAGRSGLSVNRWRRQSRALMTALWQAEERRQRGFPGEGALLLEKFASGSERLDLFRSTALYRAALLRLRSEGSESGALERGIADMRRAVEIDPRPRRFRLLWAELLMRAGRNEEVAARLKEWGSRVEERMLTYEWVLVDLLAGTPLPSERFLQRGMGEPGGDYWEVAIQTLLLARAGRCEDASAVIDALPAGTPRFDLHYYWTARCLLEADPGEAARELDRAEAAARSGYDPPLDLARLHARALVEPSSLGSAERTRARAALEREEARSRYSLHALFTLPAARGDAAAVLAATAEVSTEVK